MMLSSLISSLSAVPHTRLSGDFPVTGVSCDSRTVEKGSVFVAVRGVKEDGNRFIQEAIDRGAKAIVVGTQRHEGAETRDDVAWIEVDDERRVLAELACAFYGDPSRTVKVAGITGTNGKTTITYLIEQIVTKAGLSCGVVGTINYRFRDTVQAAPNTTPGPVELQSLLARMRDSGVGYCAMEVSSHALDQDRVRGLTFHSALFTNLTQDHLDYHKDIETYFGAKAKLFEGLSPDTTALINIDDPFGQRLTEMTRARVVTYAVDRPATVRACDVRMDMEHTEFTLDCAGESEKVSLRLIGRHNVYNALAAYAWARQAGFTHEQITSAIGDFCAVPGRLERLDSRRGFSIFVDYAHTEDALKNVLSALRQLCTHKIIVVFGCGGDRDRTKRPRMGKVVSELADLAIITSDNPRSEDPQDIIRDIAAGIPKDNFCIIPERREAIQRSLSLAQPGDIVLIAGKGHEDYQVIQGTTIHFDDREAVRECLRSTS